MYGHHRPRRDQTHRPALLRKRRIPAPRQTVAAMLIRIKIIDAFTLKVHRRVARVAVRRSGRISMRNEIASQQHLSAADAGLYERTRRAGAT